VKEWTGNIREHTQDKQHQELSGVESEQCYAVED
jgi:hypothetical protein